MAHARPRAGRFVGRKRELRILDVTLAGAAKGEGGVVVVTGPAGIGKTRFCREVAGRARRAGYAVAWGSCWPEGGAPPLWPWQEILGVLDRAAADALAADRGGSTVDPERFARFDAIAKRIGAACARAPVLIIIDDIGFADAGAMLLARFVAQALAERPLVLLLTRRTETGEAVWAVETRATLITLGCLDLAETEALLRVRRGRPLDAGLLHTVFRLTGGHPLYLQRVAASGAATGELSHGGVRTAIAWAVRRLTDKAQEVLSRAAVLGSRPTVAEAVAVSLATPAVVEHVLREAATAGLIVVEDRDGFSFSHELVREVLLDRLTPEQRADAHARAADLLSGSVAAGARRLGRLAHHALLAAPRSAADAQRAVIACRATAREAIGSFGYESAAELLASAAALLERDGAIGRAAPVLVEWAEAVLRCGRLAQARELFDRAAKAAMAEDDPVMLADAAAGLGGMWINESRTRMDRERVTALQRRALAGLPADERTHRQRLETRLAAEAVYQGGPVEPALAELANARRLGDGRVLAEALSLVHHALLTPRHTHTRLELADELVAVASQAGEGMLALLGMCWRTVDLFHLGDGAAEVALAELRQRADAVDCVSLRHIASAMETMLLIRAGRLAEAETMAYNCFQLGTEAGDADATGYLGAHLTTIRWLQGRDAEMPAMVEQIAASPLLNPAEFAFQATVASLAARTGQAGKARLLLDRLTAPGLANLPESSTWLAGMLAIVDTAGALGDAELARQAYDLLTPYADLAVMPSLAVTCFGSTERVLGLAALTFREPDRAVEHLQRAVTANRLLGNRPVTAVAVADLAEALLARRRPGDRERAEELLAQACDEAEAMGMQMRATAWRQRLTELDRRVATIRRDARHWTLNLSGRQIVVADRLGIRYLVWLLTNPGRPISALELVADPGGPRVAAATRQPILDEEARTAYQRRVRRLTGELATADARGDRERSQRLQEEMDGLLDELRRATGRRGTRAFSDAGERARTAVRKAIKRAIDEIKLSDPDLGAVLEAHVVTGNYCCYTPDPEHPLHWTNASDA